MSEVLQNEEIMKRRGIKEINRIENVINELTEYADVCPAAEVLDRIQDAIKELRKARIKLMERYNVDIDDFVKNRSKV